MKEKSTRRSARVATTLLTAAAATAMAALNGCSNSTTARCLGPDGRVLPDAACQGGTGGGAYYGGGGYGGYSRGGATVVGQQPRWVYGGSGGTSVGARASGFSTSPPSEGGISTASGTTIRGGFGSEGGAHGDSGGEGGGHGGGGE